MSFQESSFSWGPCKISILSLKNDWNPRPIHFDISNPGLIQFPANQLAYKETIYFDEIDRVEAHEMHPRGRLMLVEFEIDTNWSGADNPMHYTVDTQFQTAMTKVTNENKLQSNEIRITRIKDTLSLSVLLREYEICGARSGIRYYAPRQYMAKDCRPDFNLVGKITVAYNLDEHGNTIENEEKKPSILLNFVE